MLAHNVGKEVVLFQLLTVVILVIRVILKMLQQTDEVTKQLVLVHHCLDNADVVLLGLLVNSCIVENGLHLMVHIFERVAERVSIEITSIPKAPRS